MPALDNYASFAVGLDSPAGRFAAVTPSDSVDLAVVTRGLYVGAAGDVKITGTDGVTTTFTALTAGIVHPLRASRVWSTGTTATGIVGVS